MATLYKYYMYKFNNTQFDLKLNSSALQTYFLFGYNLIFIVKTWQLNDLNNLLINEIERNNHQSIEIIRIISLS